MKAILKALATICLVIGVALYQATPAFAQSTENPAPTVAPTNIGGVTVTPDDIEAAIESPTPNLANTTAYIFYTITVILEGAVDTPGTTPPTVDGKPTSGLSYPTSVAQATDENGLIGGVGYLMAEMINNKPAAASEYVAYLGRNSRFTGQQAYAQGLGFGALNPILGTWVAFREVAYMLLILMSIISGFLILIRHKISGQVAVTVQTVLPRIVITLILITFSYPIAGLMVEGMFLAIAFVVNIFDGTIFVPNSPVGGANSLSDLAYNTNILEFTVGYIFSGDAWRAASSLGTLVFEAIKSAIANTPFAALTDGSETADPLQGGNILLWIIRQIFTIIFGVALLIAVFRTFFALLMSYAGFIINVVLSPFILLGGVMPNSKAFENWIRNLVAGLAPFVVAIFMIFLSLALTGKQGVTQPGIGYQPSATSVTGLRMPLIMTGNIDVSAFMGLIAMGFMLLLPEAVNITKNLVGAKGGIFDQYKDKAVGAFQKGWSGSKYAPGLSGKSIIGGAGAGALVAGSGGAAEGYRTARARGANGLVAGVAGLGGGIMGAGAGTVAGGVGVPTAQFGGAMWKQSKDARKAFDGTQTFLMNRYNDATGRAKINQAAETNQPNPNTVPTPAARQNPNATGTGVDPNNISSAGDAVRDTRN